jgi:transcriptional regulator GlxA family with amidase domain
MNYEKPILRRRDVADGFLEFFLPRTDATRVVDRRALKLKQFIDTHMATFHSSLDVVCKDLGLGVSERQARRVFRSSIQMGFREYTKNRRLALAAGQLQATNISVKAIAIEAGYHSTRHFARSFKELFQLRPLEFRKVWRQRDVA